VPAHFTIVTDIKLDTIQAAKTPLETVLRNLFSNAIKHHDGQDPVITLSAKASGNFCLFEISDNGPGIPEAAQERVFRLFQTLTATERAGSGIGLALVKRLTESHGGHIELIAKDGVRGAVFRVLWPRFPRRDLDE
jgi:signal transduction histidine kinase